MKADVKLVCPYQDVPIRSHSLVCIGNHLIIVVLVRICDKTSNLFLYHIDLIVRVF